MKADIARRGLGDVDIAGVSLDTDFNTEASPPVLGWTYTVKLKSGPALHFHMANVDKAPVTCNGEEIPEWTPTN